MEAISTPTPEECQRKISDAAWSTSEEVIKGLDKICLTYGFKLAKMSGNKNYLYFQCHKGGQNKPSKEEKERDKQSKKTGR